MNLQEFTTQVIDQGIEGAREDYKDSPDRLKGALYGFEACRGKNPGELRELLLRASMESMEAFHRSTSGNGGDWYWEIRSREAEIEWVCNVVSVLLVQNGNPAIVPVTARGMMAAQRILMKSMKFEGVVSPDYDGNSVMNG